MKNISVSVDDGTYRLVHAIALRQGRTLSELFREYVDRLSAEDEPERRRELEQLRKAT